MNPLNLPANMAALRPLVDRASAPRRLMVDAGASPGGFDAIRYRLQSAYNKLTSAQTAVVDPLMQKAHAQYQGYLRSGQPIVGSAIPRELLLVQTILNGDPEHHVALTNSLSSASVGAFVNCHGEIFGSGMYQQLDPGWLQCAAIWLENMSSPHAFPSNSPMVLTIPDQVTIGIAGDWGTGDWGTPSQPAASTLVGRALAALKADYTVHLGDVYYSGLAAEETSNLVSIWPAGSKGSFTLNSNHEMLDGGEGYFDTALADPKFRAQGGASYFALENKNWVIIGLDSAYYSGAGSMFANGSLGSSPQAAFVQQMARKGKSTIVLTHHNGLEEDGSAQTGLWSEVMNAFAFNGPPLYWYWGHVHAGIVYKQQPGGAYCRCAGHGGIPWGQASELANNPQVEWFEQRSANDPNDPARVYNGLASIQLNGPSIQETFYDELGGRAWTSAR